MISPMEPMLAVAPMDLKLLKGNLSPSLNRLTSLTSHRWDPATGLGTPNYPKMKELFLSLP